MQKLTSSLFDWLTWRNGSILKMFNIKHRLPSITENRLTIRKYAVGYCDATKIPCRPKIGFIAVMFFTNFDGEELHWWTHFTIKEFNTCFPELYIEPLNP